MLQNSVVSLFWVTLKSRRWRWLNVTQTDHVEQRMRHIAAKAVLFESHPTDNDMSLDFIVEDPLVSKRKRSTRACELCRMRKVRCDGLSPQCTRCRQDFKECSYAMTRKRGPKSSNRKSSLPHNAQKDIDSEDSGKLTHITDSTFCKE